MVILKRHDGVTEQWANREISVNGEGGKKGMFYVYNISLENRRGTCGYTDVNT